MSLYDVTKELHHACEQHPIGQMFSKEAYVGRQEWTDWLAAYYVLHLVVDHSREVPFRMQRLTFLRADLDALVTPCMSPSALRFASTLALSDTVLGAAYVLHGAHLTGGRVLAKRMVERGLPTCHTVYPDPGGAREWLNQLRVCTDKKVGDQARATFACMLNVMDEIQARSTPAQVGPAAA